VSKVLKDLNRFVGKHICPDCMLKQEPTTCNGKSVKDFKGAMDSIKNTAENALHGCIGECRKSNCGDWNAARGCCEIEENALMKIKRIAEKF